MQRRMHWAILIWATLWFGLILPAHPRGAVRIPGAPMACEDCASQPMGGDSDSPCHEDKKDPVGCCAVCHWVGKIDVVYVEFFTPAPLGLIERLELACDSQIERGVILFYGERAPPVA